MMSETTKCQYCKKQAPTNEMFHGHMAMIIPNPSYEAKIDKWGRKDWFKNLERNDLSKKEKVELEDMCLYDQLLNTIGRGSACKECDKKENELYKKYYTN